MTDRKDIDIIQFDIKQESRESDKLDVESLLGYLSENLPKFLRTNKFRIAQFSGGASNITYQISNGIKSIILRRPPSGTKAKSAHDMVREFNVLDRIKSYYSLSPKPILLCEDESVIGEKFFIMEKVDGLGIDKNLPCEMTIEQQKTLCQNFIKGILELHQIDIDLPEIASLGKPEGYAERQLQGWYERFNKAKTEDVLSCDNLYQWLESNLPLNSGLKALIHNDYKFDNLVLDKEEPEKIIGLLDWEMATLGDPLLDLGCSLAYWVQADDPQALHAIRMMPTHLEGMMTRQQLFDSYCQQSGLKNVTLTPYYVFGLFRLAVIAQQIYYRFYHGQTDNPKFKNFGQLVNILIGFAEQQIKNKEV